MFTQNILHYLENAEAIKKRLQRLMEVSSTNVGVVLPMKCDMVTEIRWGEEAMAQELKLLHKKLIDKDITNPVEELCKEFSNFPEESIRQIICGNGEAIKFEW